jgi:hypothetical protein
MIGDAGENVGEPCSRIDVAEASRLDQRINVQRQNRRPCAITRLMHRSKGRGRVAGKRLLQLVNSVECVVAGRRQGLNGDFARQRLTAPPLAPILEAITDPFLVSASHFCMARLAIRICCR